MPALGTVNAEAGPEEVREDLRRQLIGFELANGPALLERLHKRFAAVSLGGGQRNRFEFPGLGRRDAQPEYRGGNRQRTNKLCSHGKVLVAKSGLGKPINVKPYDRRIHLEIQTVMLNGQQSC